MTKVLFYLLVLLFSHCIANGQDLNFTPKYITILDTSQVKKTLEQCSRGKTRKVNNSWVIRQKDKIILENNFQKIYKIKATDCCQINMKVDSLNKYAFQLIGIIRNGKKYIYINAFEVASSEDLKEEYDYWLTVPVVVCDGGESFWGVFFDINKKAFEHLAFNGN